MRVYLLSAGLARLADEMVGLALVLFVLARTDSQVLAGAVVAAYTVPSIASGPLLGAWLDRTRRPLIALAGNQFLLSAATVALLALTGRAPSVVVLGLAFLAGTTLPMSSGGFSSLLPRLGVDLPKAIAADALLFNAAALGGPAVTGVLAAVFGVDSAVLAISALSLAGGLCTLRLRVPPHEATDHPPLRQAIRDGVRHLASTPPLRGATLATSLGHGAIGVLAIALPVHVTSLGHAESAAGFVWAAMEVGCVASLLVLRRHLPRWRPEHVVFASLTATGLALATWPLAPDFAVLLALGVLVGVAEGPKLTSIITTRQRYTPPSLLGQVSTTGVSLKIGAFAVGAAVGGTLHDTTVALLAVAATQVVAAALGVATSARLRDGTPPDFATACARLRRVGIIVGMSPGAGSNAGRGKARGGQREAAKPKSAGAGKKRGKAGKSPEHEEFVADHVVTTRLHKRIQRDFPDAEAARGIVGAVRKLAVELEFPGPSGERLAAAAVIVADGTVDGFRSAVRLAHLDWRDLLMASGLGSDWENVLDEVLGPR